MGSETSAAPSAGGTGAGPAKVWRFLDLPDELQKEIFSHCTQSDLICLALVCRRFHELASSQLYRNFHIVFPDEDDPTFDSPIDGLAGGLDTFVTSEYDYAKHLRDLSLDTLSAGNKAELAYKPYLYSVSCGKFLNTLLLLTLRKAKSLDTFRWNIRVELSRPVYKALQNIRSLKNLHVRIQAGPSLYEMPPALPYQGLPSFPLTAPAPHWPDMMMATSWDISIPPAITPDPFGAAMSVPPPPPPFPGPPPPAYKSSQKPKLPKKADSMKEPPTIGGFKNLQSLSVLDIDDLGIITEINTCVRSSFSTLRKLKLSFSDALAMQARKPSVDVSPVDSDDEDEFQGVHGNTNVDDGTGPARAFRAQEERKTQESVLGRIFDVEPSAVKRHLAMKKDEKKKSREKSAKSRAEEFRVSMEQVSKRLFTEIQGHSDLNQSQQEILDLITEAAKKYVEDSLESAKRAASDQAASSGPGPTSTAAENQADTGHSDTPRAASTVDPECHQGSRQPQPARNSDEVKPEEIDVAAPEETLVIESQEQSDDRADETPESTAILAPVLTTSDPTSKASSESTSLSTQKANIHVSGANSGLLGDEANDASGQVKRLSNDDNDVSPKLREAEDRPAKPDLSMQDIQHELNVIEAEIDDVNDNHSTPTTLDDKEELRRQVSEYTRGTRGMALESLSIHLIPVKASVLGRAIDLRSLRKLTLLNVGNQVPIWTLLSKENKLQPLPLRKIFTDHVSKAFLNFVSGLERVEELFMLERGPKYKPESFAPKMKVTLTQIRRLALKKHMPTLKRLIIKNENEMCWDIDEKTMQLICARGRDLEELAAVFGIRAVHVFLQHVSDLKNLRALHVITFRTDDTCLSVMRETRRFIVDTLSHYPELKLEWLAMGGPEGDRAQHINRRKESPANKSKSKTKAKGKGKATVPANDPFPVLPFDVWNHESDSSDEDEDDSQSNLKLELSESLAFYDIWGVRIFEKEITGGRL